MADETVVYTVEITETGLEGVNERLTFTNQLLTEGNEIAMQYGETFTNSMNQIVGVSRVMAEDLDADMTSLIQLQTQEIGILQQIKDGMTSASASTEDHANHMSKSSQEARGMAEQFKEAAGMLELMNATMSIAGDRGGQLSEALNQAAAAAFAFGSAASAAASAGINPMVIVVGALAAVTVGAVAVIADIGAAWQESMTNIAVSSQLGTEAVTAIGDQAKNLATTMPQSAQSIVDAFAKVSGQLSTFYDETTLAANATGIMNDATILATATGEKESDAMQAIVSVMMAFRLGADQSSEAMNVLYNASNATGLSLETLSGIMDRIAARGGPMASDMSGLATAITLVTEAGLSGGRSVQILNTVLTDLQDPTDKAHKALELLGVDMNTYLNTTDASERLGLLAEKFNALDPALKPIVADMLGLRSETGLLINVMDEYGTNSDDVRKKIDDQAAATQAAQEKTTDFNAKLELLKDGLQTAIIDKGPAVLQFLINMAIGVQVFGDEIGDIINRLSLMNQVALDMEGGAEGLLKLPGDFAKANDAMNNGLDIAADYRSRMDAISKSIADIQASMAGVKAEGDNGGIVDSSFLTNASIAAQSAADTATNLEKYGTTVGGVANDIKKAFDGLDTSTDVTASIEKFDEAFDKLQNEADKKGPEASEAVRNAVQGIKDQLLFTASGQGGLSSTLTDEDIDQMLAPLTQYFPEKAKAAVKTTMDGLGDELAGNQPIWDEASGKAAGNAIAALEKAFADGGKSPGAGAAVGSTLSKLFEDATKTFQWSPDELESRWEEVSGLATAALNGSSDAAQHLIDIVTDLGNQMDAMNQFEAFEKKALSALDAVDSKFQSIEDDLQKWEDTSNRTLDTEMDQIDAADKLSQARLAEQSQIDDLTTAVEIRKAETTAAQQTADAITNQTAALNDFDAKQNESAASFLANQADARDSLNTQQATSMEDLQRNHQDKLADVGTQANQRMMDVEKQHYATVQERLDAEAKARDDAGRAGQAEETQYSRQLRDLKEKDAAEQTALQKKQTDDLADFTTKQGQERALFLQKQQDENDLRTTQQNNRILDIQEQRAESDLMQAYKTLLDIQYSADEHDRAVTKLNEHEDMITDEFETRQQQAVDEINNEAQAKTDALTNELDQMTALATFNAELAGESQDQIDQIATDAQTAIEQITGSSTPIESPELTRIQTYIPNAANDQYASLLTQAYGLLTSPVGAGPDAEQQYTDNLTSLTNQIKNSLPGYLTGHELGGDFMVGGNNGAADTNLVAFMASAGENVKITPSGQSSGVDIDALARMITEQLRSERQFISDMFGRRPNQLNIDGKSVGDTANDRIYRQIETRVAVGGSY